MAFLHINTHTTHNSSIRSDEGLTLETSALEFFTVAKLPSSRLGDFGLQCIVIKLQKNLVQKKNWFTCRLQARTTLISCSWRTEPEADGRCFHFKSTVKKFFFPLSFFFFVLCCVGKLTYHKYSFILPLLPIQIRAQKPVFFLVRSTNLTVYWIVR